MTPQIPYTHSRFNKAISPEQLNQIVDAILAGKYSWACVLILRFAGYNPLHYIPYRTYNRLLKENCQNGNTHPSPTDKMNTIRQVKANESPGLSSQRCSSKITDLAYLEPVGEENAKIRGGHLEKGFNERSLDPITSNLGEARLARKLLCFTGKPL